MNNARFCIILSLLGLTACNAGWDLDRLKKLEAGGSEYHKLLTAKYRKYSESEAANYDWWSSQYFAKKGVKAALGKAIEPEDPKAWRIAKSALPETLEARQKLLTVLKSGMENTNPAKAADAVFNYDCWIENLKDGWQVAEINGCRSAFYEALNLLPRASQTHKPQAAASSRQEEYVIYFDSGSAAVGSQGQRIIKQVAENIKALGDYDVVINGHTDASGQEEANMKLGLSRANAVRSALISMGVKESEINVFSFGGTDLKAQGKSPKNRRVEIFINE